MKKILVIEDEELVRANILEILESGDFEAIGAENGRIGVQLAQQHIPDLILCDIKMPELDGYGVLTTLRQNPVTSTIPLIFITAKAEKTDIRFGMNLGADDYLTKPFRRTELLGAIEARLEKQAVMQNRYSSEKTQLIASLNQIKDRLNYSIYYDQLTNLPNQLLLREQFHEIRIQASFQQRPVPILLVSLDRFNRITETLGPYFSDRLLQEVAGRLISCVRTTDTVARLNTDQFAIILAPLVETGTRNFPPPVGAWSPRPFVSPRPPSAEPSLGIPSLSEAQTILNAIAQPFCLQEHEVFLTASIGISVYPNNGDDIDNLMKHAGAAMSHAKQLGGNQYQFYTPAIQVVSLDQLTLETSLRYALERDEFLVYYQPQVDLRTGNIVGAEALVRWQHPERGLVSPAAFIPIAEETGLIVPIGEWILQTACRQTQLWQAAGLPHVKVAVNLSIRQFNQPDLSDRVLHLLNATRLDPQSLELELTESILVQNAEATIVKLKELKALGIKISLDDFGTGYSSLSYLQQFPFDILKIDRCFVRNLNDDAKNAAITTAIIQMAHSLNLKVIAEGVETQAELSFLCGHQCDAIQGYLFSRPVSADEFEQMLRSGKRLPIQPDGTFQSSFYSDPASNSL